MINRDGEHKVKLVKETGKKAKNAGLAVAEAGLWTGEFICRINSIYRSIEGWLWDIGSNVLESARDAVKEAKDK